jgi:hypothetical protein
LHAIDVLLLRQEAEVEIQVDVAVVGIDRPATGPRQACSREQEGREARRQHEPPGESEGRPHRDSFSNA